MVVILVVHTLNATASGCISAPSGRADLLGGYLVIGVILVAVGGGSLGDEPIADLCVCRTLDLREFDCTYGGGGRSVGQSTVIISL